MLSSKIWKFCGHPKGGGKTDPSGQEEEVKNADVINAHPLRRIRKYQKNVVILRKSEFEFWQDNVNNVIKAELIKFTPAPLWKWCASVLRFRSGIAPTTPSVWFPSLAIVTASRSKMIRKFRILILKPLDCVKCNNYSLVVYLPADKHELICTSQIYNKTSSHYRRLTRKRLQSQPIYNPHIY